MRILNITIDEELLGHFLYQHMVSLPSYLVQISPENRNDLQAEFDQGVHIFVTIDGSFICCNSSIDREIYVSMGALTRLWSFGFASYAFFHRYIENRSLEDQSMRYQEYDRTDSLTQDALSAICIASKKEDVSIDDLSVLNRISTTWEKSDFFTISEELFRMCMAYICIHEIAHIALGHDPSVPDHIMVEYEKEADQWTYEYVLSPVEDLTAKEMVFFKRSLGVAFANLFLVFSSIVRYNGSNPFQDRRHPKAYDRLNWSLHSFLMDYDVNDPIWCYILSVLSIICTRYQHLQPTATSFSSCYEAVQSYLDVFANHE